MTISPTSLLAQVTAATASYGEPLTFSRGGVHTQLNGFCVNAPRGGSLLADTQEAFFDDNALVALIQPVLAVYLDGTASGTNDPPQVNDNFTRDGRAYTVRAVGLHRVGSTVIAYVCLCD